MVAIACQQLTKIYRRGITPAVDNLNLRVEAGQVYGFLGINGAGKSTTIRLLLDLIRPTSGNVQIFGQSVYRNPSALQQVGALVEGASFYPYLSGWDNLRVYQWTHSAFDADRAQRLVEAVGLQSHIGKKVGQYSTGMKQRLGIAAALLHDPQLVILDEPTNGLDPAGIRGMRSFIRQLVDEQGKTVFMSSHLLGEVQSVCDHVGIIHQGRLIQEGRVDTLIESLGGQQLSIDAHPLQQAQALLAERWSVTISEQHLIVMGVARAEIPMIVRLLTENAIDIYGIDYRQPTLEDFFLSVTHLDRESLVS